MAKQSEFPPLTVKLVNTVETNWIMEGTEHSETPVRMNFPSLYNILPTSKVMKTEDPSGGYKEIRHIYGSELLDPAAQDAAKLSINTEADTIWLVNGAMTFLREGSTIGTYDYIKAYQGNKNNPRRPPDAEIEFEEIHAAELASAEVVTFDQILEAMKVLGSVREDKGDGYVYDEAKLYELASLMDIDRTGTDDEIFLALTFVARTEPGKIVNTVTNPRKRVMLDLKKAEELGVIRYEDNKVVYHDNVVMTTFAKKISKQGKITKLSEELTKPQGKDMLDYLRIQIDAFEQRSVEHVQ